MEDIIVTIEQVIRPGMIIPKPQAKGEFRVKGWGKRRGEHALIYTIPNHRNPTRPHEKGITRSEWRSACLQLLEADEFTRQWFDQNLPACSKEGDCSFTTIGGVFQLLGLARYERRGVYHRLRQ